MLKCFPPFNNLKPSQDRASNVGDVKVKTDIKEESSRSY